MKKEVALVFPGQGSQAVGMGRDLYDNFASAKEVFETVDNILGFKLSKIIFEGPADELTKTENTQPALMAVSIAIIKILEKDFGIRVADICSVVAGHSLGEYSALCAAKAMTLEQTTKLLQIRGKAMAKCGEKSSGAMAAILGLEIFAVKEVARLAASEDDVCQVANDNSAGQVVISGTVVAITRALEIAKEKGAKRAIMLPVSGAFHSSLMDEAEEEVEAALAEATIEPPVVPLIANVTASALTSPEQIKNFLKRQVTMTVRWRDTMLTMEEMGIKQIIEIGAGKVLSGLVSRTCPNIGSRSIQNIEDIKDFASQIRNSI